MDRGKLERSRGHALERAPEPPESHPDSHQPAYPRSRGQGSCRVKYFLPDAQDLVDPSFDFQTEGRSRTRIRQRDDVYAHELFDDRVVDGILVSKGIVEGFGGSGGRYTMAQRHRL